MKAIYPPNVITVTANPAFPFLWPNQAIYRAWVQGAINQDTEGTYKTGIFIKA
jgi:hypothetical protein